MFNDTFSNIAVVSWPPVLLVEETEIPREHHRSDAGNGHILSYYVVSSTL